MNLKDKINKLDWCPDGEAKELYNGFITEPFYDSGGAIEKLLMCLVYEKQYDDAIKLACDYIDIIKGDCSYVIYFFCGISYDLLNNREKAVESYKKVLQYDCLPEVRHDQFGIKFNRDLVEDLIVKPYVLENYNFEYKLQKELPVLKTPHFNIYYYPDSTAEKELGIIQTQRETAYQRISEYLHFTEDVRINLYFFEDGEIKKEITGHTGAGFAHDRTMVEIYNEQTKVNPYHELVHIIADHMYGGKISAVSEGLAVYLCNLFNDMPSIDDISDAYDGKIKEFYGNGELFSLKDLVRLNIGTPESKPFISYPQAASFVEYTIKELGKSGFFTLYNSLNNYDSLNSIIEKIESSYKKKIAAIETEWLSYAV